MRALSVLLVLLSAPALAHDPIIPANDGWFEMLKVPTDGLPLAKGNSCCSSADCKPRAFRVLGNGLYEMQDDSGRWLAFNESIFITDPEVLAANPYYQFQGCIYGGVPVCAVRGNSGG